MNSKTRWGCGIALAFALLFAIIVPIFLFNVLAQIIGGQLAFDPQPRTQSSYAETVVDGSWDRAQPQHGKIALVPISGVITNFAPGGLFGASQESMVERVQRQLHQAVNDKNIKAIVLHINSPGGEVTASDHLHQAVTEAATKKPVVAYFDSVAASGGYYLACGATSIVASETGITGSIGVIIQSLNYAELFDKAGLEIHTFASGEFKDTLSGSRPMRDDEREYIQKLVSGMYDRIVQVVAEGRDIPVAQVRNQIADGRIFTGVEALALNMVDATGTIDDAYAEARRLGAAPQAAVVRYGPGGSGLSRLLEVSASGVENSAGPDRLELDLSPALLPRLKPGLPYYLAPGMVGWEH